MRQIYAVVLVAALLIGCTACGETSTSDTGTSASSGQNDTAPPASEEEERPSSLEPQLSALSPEDAEAESGERKAVLTVNDQALAVTLYDTPAANSLYELLPLELSFEDFHGIEKIAYLTDVLTTDGEPESFDPSVGDLCLYTPWGNLSVFYQDYRDSNGLVSLGRIDSGMDVLSAMEGDFSATLEKAG